MRPFGIVRQLPGLKVGLQIIEVGIGLASEGDGEEFLLGSANGLPASVPQLCTVSVWRVAVRGVDEDLRRMAISLWSRIPICTEITT